MDGLKLNLRLFALGGITVLLMIVVFFRLYDLQIIHGGDYYRESEKKITRTVEVTAARGEIVDRYGRKLVTNRIAYNIKLDSSLMSKGSENETISELIELCEKQGYSFANNLPVVYIGGKYFNTSSPTDSQNARMSRWLDKLKLDQTLSASDIMAAMLAEYGIEGYDAETALKIAAVRWELDLRSPRIGMNLADYVFTSDVDIDLIATIKERGLAGVTVVSEPVRRYQTTGAAHILGRVTPIFDNEYTELKEQGYALSDIVGRDGAEKAFESWLRGKNGRQIEERNSSGKVTGVVYSTPPEPGGNVMLTIDIRLQQAAETALETRIAEIRELGEQGSSQGAADVAGGAVVVLDVKTFGVLAAANYPTYSLETYNRDYNSLLENPLKPMLNRAFTGRYAPGSTFKMVTSAAALESGVVTASSTITDYGLYMFYAPNYTPACEIYLTSRGTHGAINIVDAIRVSCNYFFYEVGRLSGIERLNHFAEQFGFGSPTGIELPEASGIIAGPAYREQNGGRWYGGDTIQAAIGQSDNLATPIQLAAYTAALAGDGTRKQAHLLKSVKTYDYTGTLYEAQTNALQTIELSEKNRKTILEGMLAVSKRGSTAAVFGNYAIDVGSKTGTAQIGTGSPNGILVAFAPYDNPEIAVAVVVEHAGKGSRIGNIARDIFDAYFRIGETQDTVEAENTLTY